MRLLANGGNLEELNSPGEVLLWDLEHKKGPRKFETSHGAIACVDVSADNATLVAGTADGAVLVWDIESGRVLYELLEHSSYVLDVEFQSQGKGEGLIASCDMIGSIRLHDATTGEVKGAFRETNGAFAIAFSPDGSRLASASLGATITLWDVETGLVAFELHGHKSVIFDLDFSPDGRFLASASRDGPGLGRLSIPLGGACWPFRFRGGCGADAYGPRLQFNY